MRVSVRTAALAVCAALALSACSGGGPSPKASPSLSGAWENRQASGAELAQAWFGLLSLSGQQGGSSTSEEGVAASQALVRPYLDSAFKLVRASGEEYTASTYVPLNVPQFEISDVVLTRPREDIVVLRYAVSQPGASAPDSNLVMSDDKAPRLTVLRWDETLGHWVIVSHANFNVPIAAQCDMKPITVEPVPEETSPEDVALGESLARQWRDVTTGKLQEMVVHPEGQIQLADGRGWPAGDDELPEWKPAKGYEFENLGVTRNGDLLVLSYDAVASQIVMEGDEYRSAASPRLLTYLLNPEGKWELIALANFTTRARLSPDVNCASASP